MKTFFISLKNNRETVFAGLVRGVLFLPPYFVVPVILEIQGAKGLADYILVTTILGILAVFEFGNSNNVVQPRALADDDSYQVVDRNYYQGRAKFRGFILVIALIILIVLYLLTSFLISSVSIDFDVIAAIVVGTIGLAIGFRVNVEAKIRIRDGFYGKVMKSYAISTFLSFILVFLVIYTIPKLYFMIAMQFVANQLIMLALIYKKQNATTNAGPSNRVTENIEPDRVFGFFAVAIPIQLNLVTILTSTFLSEQEFVQIALVLKLVTLPSVIINFAWTNQLWIKYAKLKIANNLQKLIQESRNDQFVCLIITLSFFIPFIFVGRELVSWWTNEKIIVSESQLIWLSILGVVRILTVVSSALQVVFHQRQFIYVTFTALIFGSLVTSGVMNEVGISSIILPSLVITEFLTIGLTGLYWLFNFRNNLKERV